MSKYRFLLTSSLIRILIYFVTSNEYYYMLLSQGCPFNIIQFSLMSLLLISDIMFSIDYIYYYLNLENLLVVRVKKRYYYLIILKKIVLAYLLIVISSLIIPYYNKSTIVLMVFDKICLFSVFSIVLLISLKNKKTLGIILSYFFMVIIRYVIM